jgi:hypothetical protein
VLHVANGPRVPSSHGSGTSDVKAEDIKVSSSTLTHEKTDITNLGENK